MAVMVDDEIDDAATVGQAANALGVTVRTLHHWDEIGLASPSHRTPAGYRLYTSLDLTRLRRVVTYREAGLPLQAIGDLLDDATADINDTLRRQRARLAERIRDLHQLDDRLERMADAHERGIVLSPAEQRAIFGPDWDPNSAYTARAAWGATTQWTQFAERSASRTPAQWQELSHALSALQRDLVDALGRGVAPGDDAAEELVDRHRELFSHLFPLTRRMQVCLGRMFEADSGFAAHYDGLSDGLATWFRMIIDASARRHGIDPDSATWG